MSSPREVLPSRDDRSGDDQHEDVAKASDTPGDPGEVTQSSASTGPSLLTLVPPFYPLLHPPPPSYVPSFVAVFSSLRGERPLLHFLEDRHIGNGRAYWVLHDIASLARSPTFTVKVFNCWESSLSAVLDIIAEEDVERLREQLTVVLEGGPGGGGWEDTEQWKVGEMKRQQLPGQLSALPLEVPHLSSSDYATRLFAHHLPEYVRPDTDDVQYAKYATDGGKDTYPKPFVYFKKRKAPPTLLDFFTPTFSSAAAAVTRTASPLIAVCATHSGGGSHLVYLQLLGNEEAIDHLRAIAEANDDEEFTVKVFRQQLTRQAVEELMGASNAETLRSLLTAALPEGPQGDGWVDTNAYAVKDFDQEIRPGTVAVLPVDNPPGCPYDNYATQVFSLHMHDFVRADSSGAKGEQVQAIKDKAR
jgi:hypothetical protein